MVVASPVGVLSNMSRVDDPTNVDAIVFMTQTIFRSAHGTG